MDIVFLSRLQFAAVTIYHFFFVPLTLGLSILLAVMETTYVVTGNEKYKKMTKFWGKLFLINFAMGVVTGIVQEFQFGMNWSEYSRFVGDIFGAPLAIEALLAFFLESTFLGIWIFSWDKLSPKLHVAMIWLVAIGANISALWILIANSWMQNPVGIEIAASGKPVLVDFFALLKNEYLLSQYFHTFFAGVTTAAFFILGISAWHILRKNKLDFFKTSFKIGSIAALIGTMMVGLFGHAQFLKVIEVQPAKAAAAEAFYETADPAGYNLFAIADESKNENLIEIQIPYMLSFMTYFRFDGEFVGLNQIQAEYEELYGEGDYIPPVNISYWSFHLMVYAGSAMGALALYAIFRIFRKSIGDGGFLLRLFVYALFLPYIANSFGWLLTEMGRQPWVVYGLMKTEEGVSSNVPAGDVLISLIGFVALYGILMVADVFLLQKYARLGPVDDNESDDSVEPKLVHAD